MWASHLRERSQLIYYYQCLFPYMNANGHKMYSIFLGRGRRVVKECDSE